MLVHSSSVVKLQSTTQLAGIHKNKKKQKQVIQLVCSCPNVCISCIFMMQHQHTLIPLILAPNKPWVSGAGPRLCSLWFQCLLLKLSWVQVSCLYICVGSPHVVARELAGCLVGGVLCGECRAEREQREESSCHYCYGAPVVGGSCCRPCPRPRPHPAQSPPRTCCELSCSCWPWSGQRAWSHWWSHPSTGWSAPGPADAHTHTDIITALAWGEAHRNNRQVFSTLRVYKP